LGNKEFPKWIGFSAACTLKGLTYAYLHHLKDRITDVAEEFGFPVIFLPKYSPNLSPIELYWAKIKLVTSAFGKI